LSVTYRWPGVYRAFMNAAVASAGSGGAEICDHVMRDRVALTQ
jgi:hypothetical protein